MGLSNPAGSSSWYVCPGCGEPVKIFSNSFYGNNGKLCKKCKTLIPPMIWDKKTETHVKFKLTTVTVYEYQKKMCPACRKKLELLDVQKPEEGKYCKWSKSHDK